MAREKKHDEGKLADIKKIAAKKKARRLAKRKILKHKLKHKELACAEKKVTADA